MCVWETAFPKLLTEFGDKNPCKNWINFLKWANQTEKLNVERFYWKRNANPEKWTAIRRMCRRRFVRLKSRKFVTRAKQETPKYVSRKYNQNEKQIKRWIEINEWNCDEEVVFCNELKQKQNEWEWNACVYVCVCVWRTDNQKFFQKR